MVPASLLRLEVLAVELHPSAETATKRGLAKKTPQRSQRPDRPSSRAAGDRSPALVSRRGVGHLSHKRVEKSPASLVGISVHPGEAVRQGMQGPRDLDQPLALALATLQGERREAALGSLRSVETATRCCLVERRRQVSCLWALFQARRSIVGSLPRTLSASSSQECQQRSVVEC